MAIAPNELNTYKSKVITDTGTNGGRLSNNLIVTDTFNNSFQAVSETELTTGSTKYRKQFFKIDDADNTFVNRVLLYLAGKSTNTDSRAVLFEATQRDTQADITGSERKYATGLMDAGYNSGDSVITATYETGMAADTVIQAGDTVVIDDGVNRGVYTVDSVAWTGEQAEITLNETLLVNYATDTIVASCIKTEPLAPAVTGFTVTSALGTYDNTTYPVLLEYLSTVEQSVTLTFTSATAFTATSDDGAVTLGTGTIAGDFEPNNAAYSLPYFTLQSAGFGGTFATNDTIEFTTSPCAVAYWIKKITSAGYVAGSADSITVSALVS